MLIADPDPEFTESLKTLLCLKKIAATTTRSGLEALNVVYALGVDLLVTNTHLRDLSGYALSETLTRDQSPHDSIPIIMLSDDATLHARLRGFLAGAMRYVCKPLDIKDLLITICRFLPDISGPAARRGAPCGEVL